MLRLTALVFVSCSFLLTRGFAWTNFPPISLVKTSKTTPLPFAYSSTLLRMDRSRLVPWRRRTWITLKLTRLSSRLYAKDTDDDTPDRDGEKMAQDFYKQAKQRQDDETIKTFENPPKFTGASSSLFDEASAPEQMTRQEFNLAGIFERTFLLQVTVLVASLIFVTYIGLSGGITNGSDRFYDDDVDFVEGIEVLEQMRTDDAISTQGGSSTTLRPDDILSSKSVWL